MLGRSGGMWGDFVADSSDSLYLLATLHWWDLKRDCLLLVNMKWNLVLKFRDAKVYQQISLTCNWFCQKFSYGKVLSFLVVMWIWLDLKAPYSHECWCLFLIVSGSEMENTFDEGFTLDQRYFIFRTTKFCDFEKTYDYL